MKIHYFLFLRTKKYKTVFDCETIFFFNRKLVFKDNKQTDPNTFKKQYKKQILTKLLNIYIKKLFSIKTFKNTFSKFILYFYLFYNKACYFQT